MEWKDLFTISNATSQYCPSRPIPSETGQGDQCILNGFLSPGQAGKKKSLPFQMQIRHHLCDKSAARKQLTEKGAKGLQRL
jgi:hypothetical protein